MRMIIKLNNQEFIKLIQTLLKSEVTNNSIMDVVRSIIDTLDINDPEPYCYYCEHCQNSHIDY